MGYGVSKRRRKVWHECVQCFRWRKSRRAEYGHWSEPSKYQRWFAVPEYMTTSIPSVDVPAGFTVPSLPSIGGAGDALPALPALSNYLTGADQGVGTNAPSSNSTSVNGMSSGQLSNNQATGGTGSTSTPVATSTIWTELSTWLKSIALPGTVSLVGLLLIIFSVWKASHNN